MSKLIKPIVLCGFMAAGKTTVGKALAKALGMSFVDTDELIVNKAKMSIPEIFSKYGETYFRNLEYDITKEVSQMSNVVVSTGGGLLTFERNAKVLSNNSIIILLKRDFDNTYLTLASDKTRPMVFNKTKEEVRRLYDERMLLYSKYSNFTVSNDHSLNICIDSIKKILNI